MTPGWIDDSGSVSVVAGVSAGVVLSMGLAVAALADVVAARHSVAAAADLAAVAAASRAAAYLPADTACLAAARVAALWRAELVACAVTAEGQVYVRLRRRLRIIGATVSAAARAGPAAPPYP